MTRVLVFGVFDGLHKGHHAFLRQARKSGDFVIVAVARDEVVRRLKGSAPRFELQRRMRELRRLPHVAKVVPGDSALGCYLVVRRHKPDVIVLGYDQRALYKDLKRHLKSFSWKPRLVTARSYKPRALHTNILRLRKAQK